jgi:SpoIID/LytB domain protein
LTVKLRNEPIVSVAIMDRQPSVRGRLHGTFSGHGLTLEAGEFSARPGPGAVILSDGTGREVARSPLIRLKGGHGSFFDLFNVTIGRRFHWERREGQTFLGDLVLRSREDGTVAAVNEIPVETYLESVIASEMSASAPGEFLKVHAVLSRSWLLAALGRRRGSGGRPYAVPKAVGHEGEVIRWYDREDHDLFDVCADDHCQRYQGITKISSGEARQAVQETRGMVITYGDEVCDARYSKACGGLTEEFQSAWEDTPLSYLVSVVDGPVPHRPITTEAQAERWCLSRPAAYCNMGDPAILETVLPASDRETEDFFRWKVEYPRRELEEIVREKSGADFGRLREIVPLARGPSGRIVRLRVVGSSMSVVVGKELEIRRWLSRTHLYSSAFIVRVTRGPGGEAERFTFHGAGWGHGVGLCQIGAAVMAAGGFSAEEILRHYFPRTARERVY